MELPQVSIYFKNSSEMLNRTSSHICGRWYLPMFLFRDGLFILMYRASFMFLMRFWSSLPSMEKLSIVTAWPEMLRWSCIGEGALRCSLNLSYNFLLTLQYIPHHNPPSHICIYIWLHFFKDHQSSKTIHCCTLPSRAEWKLQENLQEIWDWSTS